MEMREREMKRAKAGFTTGPADPQDVGEDVDYSQQQKPLAPGRTSETVAI